MAAVRSKQNGPGSTRWIQEEKEHANAAINSETADFSFNVQNELEWLNEKMADVFSRDPKTLTDVLKTPGKLRGRTPRTVRKDAPTPRQPLTDIFAPNTQAAPAVEVPKQGIVSGAPTFKIIEDIENQQPHKKTTARSKSPQRIGKPGNTDSGYHGMTEDEMDMFSQSQRTTASQFASDKEPVNKRSGVQQAMNAPDDTTRSGDDSFESAHEDLASGHATQPTALTIPQNTFMHTGNVSSHPLAMQYPHTHSAVDDQELDPTEVDMVDDFTDMVENVQPSQRKSSFNFSSLPAREPIMPKASLGGRLSTLDASMGKGAMSRVGRTASGTSVVPDDHSNEPQEAVEPPAKSTAQRLHERITLLGKTREQRNSTLVPSTTQEVHYPALPQAASAHAASAMSQERASGKQTESETEAAQSLSIYSRATADHDVRAAPERSQRPVHQNHASVPDIAALVRAETGTSQPASKAASIHNVAIASDAAVSTPRYLDSSKKRSEGPLSASKNRLMSVFKSARSIFASSASASAAAKLEAHDTSPTRSSRDVSNSSSTSAAVMQMPGALYPDTTTQQDSSRSTRSEPAKQDHSREVEAQLRAEEELEKARSAQQHDELMDQQPNSSATAKLQSVAKTDASQDDAHGTIVVTAKPPTQPTGKLRPVAKPTRPTKETAVPRPAPVSVKVGSQLQALQDSQSRPGSGLRPSSAHSTIKSTSTATTNSRVRALEAAARKKELEEREKQRKAQQKKDLERKRAARVEEEQKAEADKKAEEQRRAQEARQASQKLAEKRAADAKRQEEIRVEQQRAEQHRVEQQKYEQQRRQAALKREEDAQRAKAAQELAESIQRERAQQQAQAQSKPEATGTLRQLTSKPLGDSTARPPLNPAKPPKRILDSNDHERSIETHRQPAEQATASYQQNEGKRRKTDEKIEGGQRASVMAPPKRPSTMRKETLTRFPHGYATAQAPPTHQPSGMFKAVINSQHQMQQSQRTIPAHPNQTVQMSNARIAFADNAGPATAVPSGHPPAESSAPQYSKFKTPVRPAQIPQSAAKSAKSSPMFTQGDAIALPEIATDSEEEDDDDDDEQNAGFRAPSWVDSPALRELLKQQQLVDPETVFGPIGELKMEEVFRGAKNAERLKKFRDRGSSAAWIQNGDAVTSAEKRRDMQLRERVAREGGWRYEPGV